MTTLTKPIRRTLQQQFDRRFWCVTLETWGLSFRAKRTRKSFPISWAAIFNRAMLISAEAARQEKIARRKAKKGGVL